VRRNGSLFLGLAVLVGALGHSAKPGTSTLKKVAEFDLPGPRGKRFDYLTIAIVDHYLLSAHLAAKQIYVIDLRTNKIVATVKDTPGVEGIEYVPELKKAYTSNAYDNTIGVVDMRQMKAIKKVPTDAKPEGSAYASPFTNSTSLTSEVKPKQS
jgi:DNA-binding beta-propeller fold protein YncE